MEISNLQTPIAHTSDLPTEMIEVFRPSFFSEMQPIVLFSIPVQYPVVQYPERYQDLHIRI